MAEVRITVCRTDELAELQTVKFTIPGSATPPEEGFVIRREGELYAYRNECRHVPMTMDWTENRFLSRDRCWIQCSTHGALYDIASGLCVAGPPSGRSLFRFDVDVEGGDIVVRVPDQDSGRIR